MYSFHRYIRWDFTVEDKDLDSRLKFSFGLCKDGCCLAHLLFREACSLQTGNSFSVWCACDSFHLHWSHGCFFQVYSILLSFFFLRISYWFKVLSFSTIISVSFEPPLILINTFCKHKSYKVFGNVFLWNMIAKMKFLDNLPFQLTLKTFMSMPSIFSNLKCLKV